MIPAFDQFQAPRPDHTDPKHWQEWIASGVSPEIIAASVQSLSQEEGYNYLCYSPGLERTNAGRLALKWLKTYGHTEAGGWWCNGLDPANNWQPMTWGTFKPDCPRVDFENHKQIKYENPPRTETRAFFLPVSWTVGWTIAKRCGFGGEYGERILQAFRATKTGGQNQADGADSDRAGGLSTRDSCGVGTNPEDCSLSEQLGVWAQTNHKTAAAFLTRIDEGFWPWGWERKLPVVIVEGVKKAGSLLAAGFLAIALPGIFNGYRKETQKLIADLQLFATPGREVYICFDHDSKPRTVKQVNLATSKLGKLFDQSRCQVRVIELPGPEKGADDFIVARGHSAFQQLYDQALTLDAWRVRQYTRLTYPAALTLNQRYLGELPIPDKAKLIGLKSPKGTGKTESLVPIVKQALRDGQWILLIGHRVQLVQAICHRVGIDYITEVKDSETGKILGYGLCVDSLHPTSQALFSADGWHDGVVILDESEQVIWHTLNANTEVKRHRVPILRELKQLLSNVLSSDRGRVVLSDADLSDLSIDFVKGLAGANIEPWIVLNTWKPKEPWTVHRYNQTTPVEWLGALEADIAAGGVPLIVTDGQRAKSRWGTKTLEAKLRQRFPGKKILRIDSETIADPNHSAYGCISQLNQVLAEYDIVIASPSLETGVSIDLRGHFTGVWGCLHGVTPENSARQFLARLRESVDRHLWVAPYGLGQVGNGSTSLRSLLASEHQQAKANLHLLQDASLFLDDDEEPNIDPTALTVWGKMACRINTGMVAYRQSVFDGLRDEGHNIAEVALTGIDTEALSDDLTKVRDENYQRECAAISNSRDLTAIEYDKLSQHRAKTPEERLEERKYKLNQRYQVPVNPELVAKDDDGWYSQIRLHYYMSVGKGYLKAHDRKAVESVAHQGKTWLPDFNNSQLGLAIGILERLDPLQLLNPDQEHRGTDEHLEQMAKLAIAHKWEIKAALGLSIKDDDSPVLVAQKLLKKLGLKMSCVGRDRNSEGKAAGRVYQFVPGDDGRQTVFDAWLERDRNAVAQPEPTADPPVATSVAVEVKDLSGAENLPGTVRDDPGSVIKNIYTPTLDHSAPGSETPAPPPRLVVSRLPGANLTVTPSARQSTAAPQPPFNAGDTVRRRCDGALFQIRQIVGGRAWLKWLNQFVPIVDVLCPLNELEAA